VWLAELAVPRELFRPFLKYWAADIGNGVFGMKETTQPSRGITGNHGGSVFTSGRKRALEPKMASEHPPAPGKNRWRTGKKTCKPAQREYNPKKEFTAL